MIYIDGTRTDLICIREEWPTWPPKEPCSETSQKLSHCGQRRSEIPKHQRAGRGHNWNPAVLFCGCFATSLSTSRIQMSCPLTCGLTRFPLNSDIWRRRRCYLVMAIAAGMRCDIWLHQCTTSAETLRGRREDIRYQVVSEFVSPVPFPPIFLPFLIR